jgi:hypothetical protein
MQENIVSKVNGIRRDTFQTLLFRGLRKGNCNGWEEWVQEGKYKAESPLMQPGKTISLSKTATIKSHIAIIGESTRDSIHAMDYSRRQCLNDRMYSFWARWPAGHPRPKDVNRILDSFRVLAKEDKQ